MIREEPIHDRLILIVDDDLESGSALDRILCQEGRQAKIVSGTAYRILEDSSADIVFIELAALKGTDKGLLLELRERTPSGLWVAMADSASIDDVILAHRTGAFDFLRKPIEREDLLAVLQRCDGHLREEQERQIRLRAGDTRFEDLVENLPSALTLKSKDGQYRFGNRRFVEWFGAPAKEAFGRTAHDVFPKALADVYTAFDREVIERRVVWEQEADALFADGSRRRIAITKYPVTRADGELIGVGTISTDVTERRLAERALKLAQFSIDHASDAIFWMRQDGKIVYTNETQCEILGYTRGELLSLSFFEICADLSGEDFARSWEQIAAGGSHKFEAHLRTKDERKIPFEVSSYLLEGGDTPLICSICRDITARKRAEDQFRHYFNMPLIGSAIYGPDKHWIKVDDKFCDLLGYSRDELQGLTWVDVTHPEDVLDNLQLFDELTDGARDTYSMDKRFVRKDGDILHSSVSVQCVRRDDGSPDYYLVLVQDLTERRRAEAALRESENRLRQATQVAGLGYYVWDAVEDRCLYCSEELSRIYGTTVEDFTARAAALDDVSPFTHPEDREKTREAYWTLRRGNEIEFEHRIRTPSGEVRYVRQIAKPILGPDGSVVQECGTVQDTTDLHRAQDQLRHTQKLEAIGQLTGGVAHDFNNLLAVIHGNLELLESKIDGMPGLRRYTEACLSAARRGSELTGRLLAFGRRQPLHSVATDLNSLVSKMIELLSRTLGGAIDVEVVLDDALWVVTIDQTQLETALLNLALNARDAMPDGGRLTIESANVRLDPGDHRLGDTAQPGHYVALSVGDSGLGMTPEVLEQVFEPFFTTKPVGKGSGLGLSMVYGFVKQSEGLIRIDSEVGSGTKVTLYFPRANDTAVAGGPEAAAHIAKPSGAELVLVVEDDPDVRRTISETLAQLGYRVLQAGNGRKALELLDENEQVELLLTDVVLEGGMSGPELARQVQAQGRDLKVLFMSGHIDDHGVNDKTGEMGDSFIAKPFACKDLARKIHEVLHLEKVGS